MKEPDNDRSLHPGDCTFRLLTQYMSTHVLYQDMREVKGDEYRPISYGQ